METETKKKKKKSRTRAEIKAEKELLKSLYEEINQYMEHPQIEIAYSAKSKIEYRVYKRQAISNIINACKWFLENYNDLYTCRITYIGVRCRLVVIDSKGNWFIDYLFNGKGVYNYKCDVEMYKKFQQNTGIYDDEHYIVEVPVR